MLGPVLGGLLVGWSGQSWPLYLDAFSYALGALGTTMLHHDRRPSPSPTMERAVREDDGRRLADLARRPAATQTLHASATLYGMIGASFGLGTVAGSLLARRLHQTPCAWPDQSCSRSWSSGWCDTSATSTHLWWSLA